MRTVVFCCDCHRPTGREYEGKEPSDFGGMCDNCGNNRGVAPITWKDKDLKEEQIRYANLRS